MTRNWRRYRTLGLLGPLLLCGCGAPLEAVQATSAAGQRLSSDDRALAVLPALCLEVASLSGASDDCAALRDQGRAWTHAVAQIEAYADALSRQASPAYRRISADMLPGGLAAGSSAALKPEQRAAATALGNITSDLLTHPHEDAVLRKAIGDADGPIQLLVGSIRTVVDQRIAAIDLAETSIDVVRERLQETVAGPSSARPPAHAAEAAAGPAAPAAKKSDKAAAARDAEFELMRPTLEAVGGQLSALHDTMRRQGVANLATVPGAFAGLAAVQRDLESNRERFEHLRDTLGGFARAHSALRENVDHMESEAALVKVLGVLGEPGAPPAADVHPDPHRAL